MSTHTRSTATSTTTSTSTATSAARWLYGQILLGSLIAVFCSDGVTAVPIDLNADTRNPALDPSTDTSTPYPRSSIANNSSLHELFARVYHRPYYYGGSSSGGGPRGDWWKIVLGIAGGIILLAGMFYAARASKQRRAIADHAARQSSTNRNRNLPPMQTLGPSTSRVNAWGVDRSTSSSGQGQGQGGSRELAPGIGGVSFSHRLTPGGVVSNGARSAGGFRTATGSGNAGGNGTGVGGESTIQAPAPAYVKDAPADRVIAYGPPKYESAPASPVNYTGGSMAGNRA